MLFLEQKEGFNNWISNITLEKDMDNARQIKAKATIRDADVNKKLHIMQISTNDRINRTACLMHSLLALSDFIDIPP